MMGAAAMVARRRHRHFAARVRCQRLVQADRRARERAQLQDQQEGGDGPEHRSTLPVLHPSGNDERWVPTVVRPIVDGYGLAVSLHCTYRCTVTPAYIRIYRTEVLMVSKTERFEMRLDEDTLARVDGWRAAQADVPSRAEAMRRLVEKGLEGKVSHDMVRFSDGEKLITMMLRDLYKHLKVTSGEIDVDFMSGVITGGHYWAPKWELEGLFHDHVDDPSALTFVVDVLQMWDFIERGYEGLSKKEQARIATEAEPFGKHVMFLGFDGNNEGSHMSIARFLVEDMDRFSRFKSRDLNSHMRTLATYARMLTVFTPMLRGLVGDDLDADQIISILETRASPK
jgi:uncharacterized protein